MAVYTPVSREELESFLRAYEIGRPTDFREIAEGIENSNFRLETGHGAFVLTLYEKRVRRRDLPFFLDLMRHLRARGLPCPDPVAARDRRCLRTLNGRPAALVTFLPGRSVTRPELAQTRNVGAVLARLHLGAGDFAGDRPNDLGPAGWSRLHAACRDGADTISPGLADRIGEELAFLQSAWPTGLPEGIIHADLFPDNVLFTDDEVTGVIDFYFAARDFLAFDLAICLNAWCLDARGEMRAGHARALVEGYESVRPLRRDERGALRVLARGAAMRFLLTRLYDRLNPEPGALVMPKDPLGYLERLRFHQNTDWQDLLA